MSSMEPLKNNFDKKNRKRKITTINLNITSSSSNSSKKSSPRKIKQLEGTFSGLRILVIHSGGDSKRIPQYSALGKLFSPVPRVLPDGRSSTLFDEIIISMSSVATRIQEGMVLLSGDVLLLFNPLKIDFSLSDVGCLTFKIQPEIGKNHGVADQAAQHCC